MKLVFLIFVGACIQAIRRDCSRQKPSGSFAAASAIAWRWAAFTCAPAAISGLMAMSVSSDMMAEVAPRRALLGA